MKARALRGALVLLLTLAVAGSSSAETAPPERHPRYLLRTSDVLAIAFPMTPEFDQTVTVQPDGYIALRGAGDLYVQGQSLPEVIERLRAAYGKILHEAVIQVELKEFEKPYFIAAGELARPGKYELRGDTTVAEAVAMAGGYTGRAKHSQVLLFRRERDGWREARRLDLKAMFARKDLSEDLHLRPGDLVFIPQNGLSKIREFIPSNGLSLPGLHP